MSIDAGGGDLLFRLRVRHPHGVDSQASFLQARLARIDLGTGSVTTLKVPVVAQINGAFDEAW